MRTLNPSYFVDAPQPADEAPRMGGLSGVAVGALAYAVLSGLLAAGWLALIGAEAGVVEALLCAGPALVALVLCATSRADRRQYVARLVAAALMLPLLQAMWVGSQDGTRELPVPIWVVFTAWSLGHALVFLAAVAVLARRVTRVEAQAGTQRVDAGTLAARLRSLQAVGLPLSIEAGETAADWTLELRTADVGADRSHRVLLRLDAARAEVRVRERVAAHGAAPRDADEASLRSLGEPAFDPARPEATHGWSQTTQATMLEPDRLAAVRIALREGWVEVAPGAAVDSESLVALLCAVVTRSGWAWQPQLWERRA